MFSEKLDYPELPELSNHHNIDGNPPSDQDIKTECEASQWQYKPSYCPS